MPVITSLDPQSLQAEIFPVTKEEAAILIFGASGDLTARKLIPALFALWKDGFLSDRAPIVGIARREKSDEAYRNEMFECVASCGRLGEVDSHSWAAFAKRLFYRQADISQADDFPSLARELDAIEDDTGVQGRRVVYMATAPDLFYPAVKHLSAAGMIPGCESDGCLRVVFEKPFGHDLASSHVLSERLGRLLSEDQIYRIDHYLGKETVQNILLFRFGNAIFEPLLNRNHVDHIQITVSESQGIERGRGAYYDSSGALRDVMQNHVLQLLCLIAMEPPSLFQAENIRDEKVKVLQALTAAAPGDLSRWAVAGQYAAGEIGGESVDAYRCEDRVDPQSRRETFVAMQVFVDNWRWAGVPFYLRTGKRMPTRVTEIAIVFKSPPRHLFTTIECEGDICNTVDARPNTLIFHIQPREGISLTCSTKRPGMLYQIHPVTLDFTYASSFAESLPEAYERLLLDILRGDSTLFTRSDEVEAAWTFITPVLEAFDSPDFEPQQYAAGTWGPQAADQLLANSGRSWRTPMSENSSWNDFLV